MPGATPSVPGPPSTMSAVISETYGALDRLRMREIAVPAIAATEVLVRVRAAALHIGDCYSVKGEPFAMRLYSGLLKPKYGVPGFDVAGTVEAVGSEVTRCRPGDEVFGACDGSCAEFARVREDQLAPRPANLTHEQAAALPTSGLAALHGLRDAAKVTMGQSVLVNGASGGVGSFAVQLAKAYGATVTGVCSAANVELVRSLGADHVIDYAKEDFTRGERAYDVIFDNIENRSLSECRRALTPDGTLVLNSGTGATGIAMLVRLVRPFVVSPFTRQTLKRYLSRPNAEDLGVLKDFVEAGAVTPVIDRVFPLRETADALRYIEGGHARGKVIVAISE